MKLQQVIIAYKAASLDSQRLAATCAQDLEAQGVKVLLGPVGPRDNPFPVFLASVHEPIDLALVLGGDGSVLTAARFLAQESVPILAVKVGGHLGFLTQALEHFLPLEQTWARLREDRYAVEQRMMLEAWLGEGSRENWQPLSGPYYALNEFCIKPSVQDRMPVCLLEMEVDGEVVDQYQGDGLIISTPTGSTCYTTAANGPILHPGLEAIAVTPICPMSLSSRPLVLPPRSEINVWPLSSSDDMIKLWMDGVLSTSVWPGQRVDIHISPYQAQFIILDENSSYYRTLREKLQWAGALVRYERNQQN